MTKRVHVPVTVIVDDSVEDAEARDWVDHIIKNLAQHDDVHRAFAEEDVSEDEEVQRLLDVLQRFDERDLATAESFIKEVDSDALE